MGVRVAAVDAGAAGPPAKCAWAESGVPGRAVVAAGDDPEPAGPVAPPALPARSAWPGQQAGGPGVRRRRVRAIAQLLGSQTAPHSAGQPVGWTLPPGRPTAHSDMVRAIDALAGAGRTAWSWPTE